MESEQTGDPTPTTAGTPLRARDDLVTIRVSRAGLYAALGVVLGLLVGAGTGFAVGRTTAPDDVARPAAAPAAPATTPAAPAQPQESTPPAVVPDVAVEGRPAQGDADAPVTIVEFTDYQCPYCGAFARDTEDALLDAYGDDVRFVVRHFPITGSHQYAQKAAEAAECAFDQDRFWEYHDVLFAHQDALDEASLRRYAKEVGLDTRVFAACLASGEKAAVVATDQADGQRYGVSATPTFFINGQRFVGAKPIDEFEQVVDGLLAADD